MARPWSKKKSERKEDPAPEASQPPARGTGESERLDDDSHAWWAQAEVEEVWKPRPRRKAQDDDKRDILAEHFGDDWRTNFLYTPPTEEELEAARLRELQELEDQDPYKVLQVDESATWDEIVAAHRHMARVHHPDRLFGQSEDEKADSEERIRIVNQAYQELRVRRGK
jgi:predicted DNA-binding protein (UPF0251 family)